MSSRPVSPGSIVVVPRSRNSNGGSRLVLSSSPAGLPSLSGGGSGGGGVGAPPHLWPADEIDALRRSPTGGGGRLEDERILAPHALDQEERVVDVDDSDEVTT